MPRIGDVTALLEGLGQSRLFFVDRLIAMGARIVLCDPHRALVVGPTELRGPDGMPFAQERLRLRSDGRVALALKTAWHEGTREVVFEPLEFLERLAAMTPRPETNLLICHGVLAPRARWRERVVAYGRVLPEPTAAAAPLAAGPDDAGVKPTPRAWTWAALMHRAFAIDVLTCPHCGGRRRLIATLHDPGVIRKILAHLGVGLSGPSPGPAPPEPGAVAPARRGVLSADPAGPLAG